MEVGKSFAYIFEDKEWFNKLGLGTIISAIPILNFAWVGYTVEIMRNVSQRDPNPLPDWSDLGNKFIKGLILLLVGIIYALPALFLAGISLVAIGIPAIVSGDFQETMAAILTGTGVLLSCLIALYALAVSFFFPAVYLHYAGKGTFGACFEVKEILKIATSNLGNFVIAWLMSIILGFVIGLIAGAVSVLIGWVPCIGWIISWIVTAFAGVWTSTVYAHLFGQVGALQPAQ